MQTNLSKVFFLPYKIKKKTTKLIFFSIFYGCHSWKGHDVSESQLRQPFTIILKHIYTKEKINKEKKLERASQKEELPHLTAGGQ